MSDENFSRIYEDVSSVATRLRVTLRGDGGKLTGTEIEMGGGKAVSGSKIVIGKCAICVRDW